MIQYFLYLFMCYNLFILKFSNLTYQSKPRQFDELQEITVLISFVWLWDLQRQTRLSAAWSSHQWDIETRQVVWLRYTRQQSQKNKKISRIFYRLDEETVFLLVCLFVIMTIKMYNTPCICVVRYISPAHTVLTLLRVGGWKKKHFCTVMWKQSKIVLCIDASLYCLHFVLYNILKWFD